MRITVKNFRGVETASLEAEPIALIAGQNYAGKSSICLAVAAALSGQSMPYLKPSKDGAPTSLFTKSQAGTLVRAGMDKGSVTVENETGKVVVTWPELERKTEGAAPYASVFAAGLMHVVDMEDKARSTFLTGLLGAATDMSDLAQALPEVSGDSLNNIWKAIEVNGWDKAHGKAKEHGATLKGQWEATTNERYGSAKAAGWLPQGWDESLKDASQQQLEARVAEAKQELETAVAGAAVNDHEIARRRGIIESAKPEERDGAVQSIEQLQDDLAQARQGLEQAVANQAVDDTEIQRLQGIADSANDLPDYSNELAKAKDAHQQAVDERTTLPPAEKPASTQPCPHCAKPLIVVGSHVQAPPEQLSKAEYEKRVKAIEKADTKVQAAKLKVSDVERRIAANDQQKGLAKAAKDKLAEIAAKPKVTQQEIDAARTRVAALEAAIALQRRIREVAKAREELEILTSKPVTPATVLESAREAVRIAEERLRMFTAKSQADRLHASIERNQKVIDALAPDGLRKIKLLRVLDAFNQNLRELCDPAGFKAVSVDEEMTIRYGGRHYVLLSESEKYRVRAVFQIAIALRDGSNMVILDGADILDTHGRNGLMALLQATGLRALIAMTISDRKAVPDLRSAEIGESYWIEQGVCASLRATQSVAA